MTYFFFVYFEQEGPCHYCNNSIIELSIKRNFGEILCTCDILYKGIVSSHNIDNETYFNFSYGERYFLSEISDLKDIVRKSIISSYKDIIPKSIKIYDINDVVNFNK